MSKLLVLSSLVIFSAGCISGKNKWVGLVPGKDFEIINGEVTLTTPWGMEVIKAAAIRSFVNPKGEREHWAYSSNAAPASVLVTPSLSIRPQ